MTTNKHALCELIADARERRFDKLVITVDEMESIVNELEAAERRNAELTASHDKLRENMAAIYNAICADGASTSLSAILTFVKRSFEQSGTATDKGE